MPTRPQFSAQPKPIPPPAQALYPGEPRQIRVPALGIEASVEAAGLNDKGEMEAPPTRNGVGWYKLGYLPGALGNSVMAGHSMHKTGKGVFYNLHKLALNDSIEIVTSDQVLTFVVRDKSMYSADDPKPVAVFGPSPEAKLNLITCQGVWDAQQKRYAERLVVSAQFVRERPR